MQPKAISQAKLGVIEIVGYLWELPSARTLKSANPNLKVFTPDRFLKI